MKGNTMQTEELVVSAEIKAPSSTPKNKPTSPQPAPKPKPKPGKRVFDYEYQRDKEREMVRGKFIFHEVPGGKMDFVFKKWEGDEIQMYSLSDGEIYTIPLAVAIHLNKNCHYPIHTHALDDNGNPSVRVGQKVRRCSFQSLEFVDIADLTPDGGIVTVEYLK
jgi:hypothetical protein